jgi:hypothetical protein
MPHRSYDNGFIDSCLIIPSSQFQSTPKRLVLTIRLDELYSTHAEKLMMARVYDGRRALDHAKQLAGRAKPLPMRSGSVRFTRVR